MDKDIAFDSDSKDTIKIGATLALSGKLAFIGAQELNGFEIAVEEINSNGGILGKDLVLIVDDNKGETKDAVNGVTRLITADNVPIVFSAFTHITTAIAEIVNSNNRVLIYASTIPDMAIKDNYTFRDYVDARDNGEVIAKAVKNAGYNNVALLAEKSDVCDPFFDSFIETANSLGVKTLAYETFQSTETDFRTLLLKLKLVNADALVVCVWRHEHLLMPQFSELGLKVPTFHLAAPFLPVSDTAEMREIYEKNSAISSWYSILKESKNERGKSFVRKYEVKFRSTPRPEAEYAYDLIYVIEKVLENCNADPLDRECFRNEMLKISYDGVGGHLEFDKDGVSKRDVTLITVKNGEWVEI